MPIPVAAAGYEAFRRGYGTDRGGLGAAHGVDRGGRDVGDCLLRGILRGLGPGFGHDFGRGFSCGDSAVAAAATTTAAGRVVRAKGVGARGTRGTGVAHGGVAGA